MHTKKEEATYCTPSFWVTYLTNPFFLSKWAPQPHHNHPPHHHLRDHLEVTKKEGQIWSKPKHNTRCNKWMANSILILLLIQIWLRFVKSNKWRHSLLHFCASKLSLGVVSAAKQVWPSFCFAFWNREAGRRGINGGQFLATQQHFVRMVGEKEREDGSGMHRVLYKLYTAKSRNAKQNGFFCLWMRAGKCVYLYYSVLASPLHSLHGLSTLYKTQKERKTLQDTCKKPLKYLWKCNRH